MSYFTKLLLLFQGICKSGLHSELRLLCRGWGVEGRSVKKESEIKSNKYDLCWEIKSFVDAAMLTFISIKSN